jgi:hypothetical protein
MRYFHNFYGIFQLSEKVGLTVGFDYGVEEKNAETSATNAWLSPVAIAKFTLSAKAAIAVRAEYYDDEHGIIIATNAPGGFKTTGLSANFDYSILPNAVWRLEIRNFTSKDEVFMKDGEPSKTNTSIATSLAVSL